MDNFDSLPPAPLAMPKQALESPSAIKRTLNWILALVVRDTRPTVRREP